MASNSQARLERGILAGRFALARKDFAGARNIFEKTINRFPTAVWPRLFLSQALLQGSKDRAAAEQALREVLDIDPNNRDARKNLEILLKRPSSPSRGKRP